MPPKSRRIAAALLSCAVPVWAAIRPALGAPGDWTGFPVILWQDPTPAQRPGLAAIGIDAVKISGQRGRFDAAAITRSADALRAAGLRWMVENIATDHYAAYHRFTPDHPPGWRFDELKRRFRADRSDRSVFDRDPSLSDPAAFTPIAERLAAHVRALSPYRPLYYSLGDESGVGDLASAWDFDLSPASLAGMRTWLHGEYGTLDALNRQWGTDFIGWDEVMPETTDAAMARTDENFSAWSDFKAWTDVAFARALRAGTDAVHGADPDALAAIEGAQIPGWGGYDYAALAGTVDLMEMYDLGDNIDIARSLNPGLIVLTTSFGRGPREAWRIWHEVLLGARGLIIWDERGEMLGPDGTPGPRGRELAPLLADIRAQPDLLAARPKPGRVAILYSPASFRVHWLRDRRADGTDWTLRDAEAENGDSTLRRSMRETARALANAGLQPRWVSPRSLAAGLPDGIRALVLPQAVALSDAEREAIAAFRDKGGLVLADGPAGSFDGHGARRTGPALDLEQIPPPRLVGRLASSGIRPEFAVEDADGRVATDVAVRLFCDALHRTLVTLHRDRPEAGEPAGKPVVLRPPTPVTDLLDPAHPAADTRPVRLTLDPVRPSVIAITPSDERCP